MPSPASSHGLQDWYLRACDGEWDAGPGVTVDPLEVGRAWAGLPTRAADAAEAPRTGRITGLPRNAGDPPRDGHGARPSSRSRRRP